MSFLSSAAALVLLLLVCRAAYARWRDRNIRLPPGPKGVPLFGNILQLPAEYQHEGMAKWSKQYGDVVYARLFQTPAIILNSLRAAQDLLEKRSANYSDRPRMILHVELMGWDKVCAQMRYGDRLRKHRRWIHAALNEKVALQAYQSLQRREAYMFLLGLFDTPNAFMLHIRRFVAGMIMEVGYGHTVMSLDDKFIQIAERATTETVEAAGAMSMLVDFFPILLYLPSWAPGAGFKRTAFKIRKFAADLLDTPYEMVKSQLASGTARQSFTAKLLEEHTANGPLTPADEDDIKGAGGVLYGAGTDTSVTAISTFILAMARYPRVFDKLQEEMDRVVGTERLPDFDDRESLPYLECVLKEVYRWNPPLPINFPHRAMSSDRYRGYDIPEGATILTNIWAMTREEDLYTDPEDFRPERFEEMDAATAEARDPRNMVFGFGRRVCPGRHFADANVYIVLASMVAAVDIRRARDSRGEEIVPKAEFVSAFTAHPKPFSCDIRPRSNKVQDLVGQMYASIVV